MQDNDPQMKVIQLCEQIGYGAVMQTAAIQWQMKALREGDLGVGRVIGPHIGATVNCGCLEHVAEVEQCDWCCGSGWLTPKVKQLQDKEAGW